MYNIHAGLLDSVTQLLQSTWLLRNARVCQKHFKKVHLTLLSKMHINGRFVHLNEAEIPYRDNSLYNT